jgi:hypothetical protein
MKNKKFYKKYSIIIKDNKITFLIDGEQSKSFKDSTITWWEIEEDIGTRIVGTRIK